MQVPHILTYKFVYKCYVWRDFFYPSTHMEANQANCIPLALKRNGLLMYTCITQALNAICKPEWSKAYMIYMEQDWKLHLIDTFHKDSPKLCQRYNLAAFWHLLGIKMPLRFACVTCAHVTNFQSCSLYIVCDLLNRAFINPRSACMQQGLL